MKNDPGNHTLTNFVDILHAVSGHTESSINESLHIATDLDHKLSTALRYRLVALCIEYRVPIPNSLLPLHPNKVLQRYPTLLANSFDAFQPRDSARQARGSGLENLTTLAKQLTHRTHDLTEHLAARTGLKRICIVGNAPTELGKNQMKVIDSADVVFRFNHANTGEAYQQAYGSRTDYWTISPSYPLQENNLIANNVVISGISPFDKPSLYWQSLAQHKDVRFFIYPKSIWYALVDRLDAPPSAGLLCLASLMQWRTGEVQIDTFGLNRGEVSKQNHYADSTKRSSRHNWSRESMMVRELTADTVN